MSGDLVVALLGIVFLLGKVVGIIAHAMRTPTPVDPKEIQP